MLAQISLSARLYHIMKSWIYKTISYYLANTPNCKSLSWYRVVPKQAAINDKIGPWHYSAKRHQHGRMRHHKAHSQLISIFQWWFPAWKLVGCEGCGLISWVNALCIFTFKHYLHCQHTASCSWKSGLQSKFEPIWDFNFHCRKESLTRSWPRSPYCGSCTQVGINVLQAPPTTFGLWFMMGYRVPHLFLAFLCNLCAVQCRGACSLGASFCF